MMAKVANMAKMIRAYMRYAFLLVGKPTTKYITTY